MGHWLSVTCCSKFPVGVSCWWETSAVKADTHQLGWESCFFASILWIKSFCLQSGKRHRARQCRELLLSVVQCNPCTQSSFPLPVLEGPPPAAGVRDSFSVQAPRYLIPSLLLPFTEHFQYNFFNTDLTSLPFYNLPSHTSSWRQKNPRETGNTLFSISAQTNYEFWESPQWLLIPLEKKCTSLI